MAAPTGTAEDTRAGNFSSVPGMDIERAREFLGRNHRAVLITTRADGSPQGSPVVAGVDSEGRAVVSTRETAMKAAHVRRTPRAALCVMQDSFFGEWIQVEGPARLIPLPRALDDLVALYRQVAGEHADWDDYRTAMERERRVLLAISIERAGPDRSG